MTRSPILSYSKTVLSRGIKVFSLDLQWLSTDTLTGATSMVRVSLKLSALATKSLPLSAGATLRGNSWSQGALVTSLMICLMGGMITCRSNQWSGKSTMSRLGRRWRELFWSWWFYRACSVSAGAGAGTAAESSNRWRSGCALRSASQWRSTCSLAAQHISMKLYSGANEPHKIEVLQGPDSHKYHNKTGDRCKKHEVGLIALVVLGRNWFMQIRPPSARCLFVAQQMRQLRWTSHQSEELI